MGDVVLGASEAGRIFDHRPTDSGSWGAMCVGVVLADDEEPGHREHSGICCIDDGVEHVEPGKDKALERRLFPDVRCEGGGQHEGEERVYVHG